MPRRKRPPFDEIVLHVMNRGVKRAPLFTLAQHFWEFERLMFETLRIAPLRILAFCLMPNHWHLVVWPRTRIELWTFMHRLTQRHAMLVHRIFGTVGEGAVYQGRYPAFPVKSDGHLLRVLRYVERNALRANLVARAEDWRWGSLWHRLAGNRGGLLADGPLVLPADWVERVNRADTPDELEALRRSVRLGLPYGDGAWAERLAETWSAGRPPGRPPKTRPGNGDGTA